MSCDLFSLPVFAPAHRGGPRECADKLVSEAAEVFAEVREYDATVEEKNSYYYEIESRVCVALEIADVLQVCRNVCEVCGITKAMMVDAVAACIEKNEHKDGGRY